MRAKPEAMFNPSIDRLEELGFGGELLAFYRQLENEHGQAMNLSVALGGQESELEGVTVAGLRAYDSLVEMLDTKNGTVTLVVGHMGCGKSTMVVRLSELDGSVQLFQHRFGFERNGDGDERVITQGEPPKVSRGKAFTFSTLEDVYDNVVWGKGVRVVIDEAHFVGNKKNRNLELDPEVLVRMVAKAQETGSNLVFVGLDMTYEARLWENTKQLLRVADRVIVLSGECRVEEGCGRPAFYTERFEVVDGKRRLDMGEVLKVGGVDEEYVAACLSHHRAGRSDG